MIKLYSDADPNAPHGATDFFSFSYLHGEARRLNDVVMTRNGWDPTASDLFVADREPTEDEKHLVKSEFSLKWDQKSIQRGIGEGKRLEDYGIPGGSHKIVDMSMFAIECDFYGDLFIAFILERKVYELWGWSLNPEGAFIFIQSEDAEEYLQGYPERRGRVVLKLDELSLHEYLERATEESLSGWKKDALNTWEHALSYEEWM